MDDNCPLAVVFVKLAAAVRSGPRDPTESLATERDVAGHGPGTPEGREAAQNLLVRLASLRLPR